MIDRAEPVQVRGLSGVVSASAGSSDSLAVLSDGTVWTWGTYQPEPTRVAARP